MTDNTSLINLSLQAMGSRTTITAAELAANSTNEAIQANLAFDNTRDGLLRMAPWNCGMKTANLVYITSQPGTPENTSPATVLWQPGQPRPPWAYEYQYPIDCLKPCWMIPASQTGFTGIPITTAVTGGAANTWLGGPIVYKVGIDEFFMVASAAVVAGGSGYSVGEVITLDNVVNTSVGPQGAPASLTVATIGVGGAVATVTVVNQLIGNVPSLGGSYYYGYEDPIGGTSLSGSGATFNLTFNGSLVDQRVILTNQEFATLVYVKQVTNPSVWDPLFQDAFQDALAANLVMALIGDKGLANGFIAKANNTINEARKADGNEGLTINDVTPDWIRTRGFGFDSQYLGQSSNFDWGGLLPSYG